MRNSKGFIQIPFSWLFAIVIGALILFFAIYASVRLIKTETTITSEETGKEISVLLNPLETGFGEEKTTSLAIPMESKISNSCGIGGNFGQQQISVSQKINGQWADTGIGPIFYNKYIFSNKSVQGKNFFLFSKPFEFPFKVSDLIFFTSAGDNYCFTNAPANIEQELSNLNQGNLFTKNCPVGSINVCFSSGNNCNIQVNKNQKTVNKDGKTVYFETDALMYGAVFSDPAIYECQVQRLMKRVRELALVYNDKETIISQKSCPIEVNLLGIANSATSLKDSSDLTNVKAAVDSTSDQNKRAYCKLW